MDFSKSTNIIDRLANLKFKATDFVQVINIDDEPFEWDFVTEEVNTPGSDGVTSTRAAKQDKFRLDPGQESEMPGNVALVFIDKLVKHMIQKDGRSKMINIISVQDEWVDRIFLGKKGVALPYASNSVDPDTGSRILKSAEVSTLPLEEIAFPEIAGTEVKRGRPAKTSA